MIRVFSQTVFSMTMFSKILIANRSEIAMRVMRTCREMGIATVAVYSEHDVDALFVRKADEAVPLPSAPSQRGSPYLDIAAIVDAARLTGATAIHPGYGFLSENAEFASAVLDAGIAFIGPAPETIHAMGSKLESRKIMAGAGVPVLAVVELRDNVDAVEAAAPLGYPLLVKAAHGGGGKGMRIVASPAGLQEAIESAARESASAFGDNTVYLEEYVTSSRHIEVQIVGDGEGHVVHLYERECSIQRRFQKVIEETPSPGLDAGLRERLWEAAVTAGKAVSYRGVGTVEFIVDSSRANGSGNFAFLEMNTRIQVEHPVTEMTTGIDLVRMQIEVAAGVPLMAQGDIPAREGHAIEARLNAESTADGYLPSTGVVHRFSVPDGVRVDTGITDGSVVTHHYDPMIAKVVAHAPTRGEAAAVLVRALQGSRIHGVETNRVLLARILSSDEFLTGAVDTGFLERRGDDFTAPAMSEGALHSSAAAAALWIQAENRRRATVLPSIPSGWRNVPSQPHSLTLLHGGEPIAVSYRLHRDSVEVAVNDAAVALDTVHSITETTVDLAINGVRRSFDVSHLGHDLYVDSSLGSTHFTVAPKFPVADTGAAQGSMSGTVIAKTPGNVVSVPVAPGDEVAFGDAVMVIEAMKMEQALLASGDGTVTAVHFAVGDQVAAGATLVEIDTVQHDTEGRDD